MKLRRIRIMLLRTQLSLVEAKTTKVYEVQQNVALVENMILEKDIEKILEGDNDSDGGEFADTMILSDEDSDDRIEPVSQKEIAKENVDDDENNDYDKHDNAKIDEDKDDDDDHTDLALVRTQRTGSVDIRTDKMQKPILISCSISTHFYYFQNIMKKVDKSLREIVHKLATSTTNDLMKDNLLRLVTNVVKKEIVHPTSSTSTASIPDLQQQLYLKMKSDLQSQVADHDLWNALKAKFENSSAVIDSCRFDAFLKRDHDDHPGDDAPQEGDKSTKRHKTSKISKSARGSSSKQPAKESNTSASEQPHQQDFDAWVEILVIDEDERNPNDHPRYLYNKDLFFLKNKNTEKKRYVFSLHKVHATLFPNDNLEKKIFGGYVESLKLSMKMHGYQFNIGKIHVTKRLYKIKQRKERVDPEEVFSDHKITKVVRVTSDKKYGLDFMEEIIVKRDNNKPTSFSELDIEIDHIKINLAALTLNFPSIKECNPYSIIDEPSVGLIYLNNKEEKRVMDLIDISKFCDATLEKVLKEVKLKILR
ncbi:hypothetical protein Tco_0305161 [Tanacetum coccineum]